MAPPQVLKLLPGDI